MRYYDIHTHHKPIHTEDVAIVNTIVAPAGIIPAHIPAADVQLSANSLKSAGIHPLYIYDIKKQLIELERLLTHPEMVAIGECGLDKRAETPMDVQRFLLEQQVLLAEKLQRFLIIHCVKAWPELIATRKKIIPSVPWTVHGFRGNGELAGQLLKQNFYLSFGAYFNPEAVRAAWPDRLLAETDDKEIDIRSVYACLADTLSLPVGRLALQIEKNVRALSPAFEKE